MNFLEYLQEILNHLLKKFTFLKIVVLNSEMLLMTAILMEIIPASHLGSLIIYFIEISN